MDQEPSIVDLPQVVAGSGAAGMAEVDALESMQSTGSASVHVDPALDAATIRAADWPQREFPLPMSRRGSGFQAVVRQSVLNDIAEHGSSSPDAEVCGVLVGSVYQDAVGPFLLIEASIRGQHADNRAAQVTFTADTWAHVQEVMDQRYPESRMVGWYHTHPDYGVFLSEMDLFIHANFFNLPWQVAFVCDPIRRQQGLFVWRAGEAVMGPFLVETDVESRSAHPPDDAALLATLAEDGPVQVDSAAAVDRNMELTRAVAQLREQLRELHRRQRWMATTMATVLAVGVLWLGYLTADPERNGGKRIGRWLLDTASARLASERERPLNDFDKQPLPDLNENASIDSDGMPTTDEDALAR